MNSGCECTSGAGVLDDWAGSLHGLMTDPVCFKNIRFGYTSGAALYLIQILKKSFKEQIVGEATL